MKKWILMIMLLLLLSGCGKQPEPVMAETVPPETVAIAVRETTASTEAPTEVPTEPAAVYDFTEDEKMLLLKIGMAERGDTGCVDCIALVMRTVLNRVEGPKFSSTIKGVIYAQDQFTPVAEGTFAHVQPNEICQEALARIICGWDDSQGALYYEWCEGESWHSKNLNLLLQHCDTRFYN